MGGERGMAPIQPARAQRPGWKGQRRLLSPLCSLTGETSMDEDKKGHRTKETKNISSTFLLLRSSYSIHGIVQRLAGLHPVQTILTLTLGMSSSEEKNITGGGLGNDTFMCQLILVSWAHSGSTFPTLPCS